MAAEGRDFQVSLQLVRCRTITC